MAQLKNMPIARPKAVPNRPSSLSAPGGCSPVSAKRTHTREGLDAARRIRVEHPPAGVLVLSQYVESHHAMQLLEDGAGGVGYLLKDRVADVREVVEAVHRVAGGGSVIDPEVVAQPVGRRRARNPSRS
jgi:DNA-binding NarL/FixJ family response regulator